MSDTRRLNLQSVATIVSILAMVGTWVYTAAADRSTMGAQVQQNSIAIDRLDARLSKLEQSGDRLVRVEEKIDAMRRDVDELKRRP